MRVLDFIASLANSAMRVLGITSSLMMNLATDESAASLVASYLAAIGTIFAVLVALSCKSFLFAYFDLCCQSSSR
jgi:hypothetical protein